MAITLISFVFVGCTFFFFVFFDCYRIASFVWQRKRALKLKMKKIKEIRTENRAGGGGVFTKVGK